MPRARTDPRVLLAVGGAILGVFVLTRALLLGRFPLSYDEALYAEWALDVLDDSAVRFVPLGSGIGPLFPWLGSIGMWLGVAPFTALRLVSTIAGLLTVVMRCLIARDLGDWRDGLAAAGLAAIVPFFVVYDAVGIFDPLATALVTTAVFLMIRLGRGPALSDSVLLGILLGAGLLVGQTSIFALALLPAALFVFDWSSLGRRRRLAAWLGSVAVSLALASRSTRSTRATRSSGRARPRPRTCASWRITPRIRSPTDLIAVALGRRELERVPVRPHGLRHDPDHRGCGRRCRGGTAAPSAVHHVDPALVPGPLRRHAASGRDSVPAVPDGRDPPVADPGRARDRRDPRPPSTSPLGRARAAALAAFATILLGPALLVDARDPASPESTAYPGLDDPQYVRTGTALPPYERIARDLRRHAPARPVQVVLGEFTSSYLPIEFRDEPEFRNEPRVTFGYDDRAAPHCSALYAVSSERPLRPRSGVMTWQELERYARPRNGTSSVLFDSGVQYRGRTAVRPDELRKLIGPDSAYDRFGARHPCVQMWAEAWYALHRRA